MMPNQSIRPSDVTRPWRSTHSVLLPTAGGAAVGLIAVVFPLTIASGRDQLADGVREASALGAALLVGVVLANPRDGAEPRDGFIRGWRRLRTIIAVASPAAIAAIQLMAL